MDDSLKLSTPQAALLCRLQPGARVGPYELIRLLGAGGMAQVWLARRADGAFKRELALKLPLLHTHRADLAGRFARERDILAALEHPQIARLYDAGVDEGLPYLAMEYVSGEALTQWCDKRNLAVTERLDLFLQVLSAVQYAHERQVIHRDLKPSNILVTQDGQVRLLDFGVARLLESSNQAPLTESHGRALTPAYASPELLRGEAVDARSDVYSLGVVLHELLTGKRTTTVRRLRGDLDAIARKALAKEPARRYPTVLALAQDVRCYLEGRPVQARAARWGYWAWKFVRRRQAAATAIALALAVVLMAVGYVLHRKPNATPSGQSVAVLPFVDLSESHDQEYFSDGLTEEVLDLLAKVPDLRVIARTSSFSFKGRSDDIPTIARRLNVANILAGSVRKSGRRLRVTTHLVRAATGETLWSQTYDRELQDVFQVQDEIAAAVTRALQMKLAAGRQAGNGRRARNTDAYTQYLIGQQFLRRDTAEGEELARQAFLRAIELDSGYAAAYAGLATAQSLLASITDQVSADLLGPANAAVTLAPDEPAGYVTRAEILQYHFWNWAAARADLEKALAIEPADNDALLQYGELLSTLGSIPQAIAVVKQATELDPLSVRAWRQLSYLFLEDRQPAAAHAAARRARELHPEPGYAPFHFGREALLEGNASQALETFRHCQSDWYRLTGIALAEQTLGHDGQSRRALDELIAGSAQGAAYQIAQVYAWRGAKDEAFAWLEQAYQQRDPGMTDVKMDPLLASLHGAARFNTLLAKMHLQ